MRYWYVNVEIINGEYTFHERWLERTQANKEYDPEETIAEFYGCPEGKQEGTDWYTFDCGCVAVRLYDLRELKKKDYDVLKKYLP